MNLKGKNVLVTGAGGFIGSHLTEKLAGMGCSVACFVRYNSRNDRGMIELLSKETQEKLEIIPGDLCDAEAVRQAVKGRDAVFHLGAIISIPYSYVHPRETFETNVMGTFNVMAAAKDAGVKKIVHTSTSETYGTALKVPISEDHPMQGQSPYSASKIGADKVAESFFKSYDLPVATVRPFNAYGPRQSARAIIPTIITQALSGSVIRMGNPKPTRDFTFVRDTVNGFVRAAEEDKAVGETINLGSGKEISIGDLVKRISELTGKNPKIEFQEQRMRPEKSEVMRLCCDNSKAKRILGWEPKTSLDEGLKETIKWISENAHLYKPKEYNI